MPARGEPSLVLRALCCASAPLAQLLWEAAGPQPAEDPEHPSLRPHGVEMLGAGLGTRPLLSQICPLDLQRGKALGALLKCAGPSLQEEQLFPRRG